ncbi:CPBP family intramembrane glutamic endopeptidase [Microbacterium sp. 1.5R]|uniref:CPBP family intramembrane glutamic endopeptidase n=1 Tax=Microbacterium sp. 1.5R TaxID=1916917 RepID=UPI001642CBF5|nr:type II CAAX endopeptidase family protein [Microbacterium sp. 1.5R]
MSLRSNPFVEDALGGRRLTPWWIALPLVFLVLILGVQTAANAALGAFWNPPAGSPASQLKETITFAVAAVVLILWVTLFERRRIWTLGFRRPRTGVLVMLGGLLAGGIAISIPALFLWGIGAYERVTPPEDAVTGPSAGVLLVLLALTFFIQGGTEELLTRGYLLQTGGAALPAWLAVLLPALLFTLIHGVIGDPLPFATIFLYALFASFLVLRLGSLWLVIGFHAGWNFTMGNIYGIPVSGLPPLSTSAMYLQPAEEAPDWLTGGDFGTEASLPAVIVLATLTLIAFFAYRRSPARRARGAVRP